MPTHLHCAQIGNGSNVAIEFEVQCRLIQAIPDANIELQKQLLKVNYEKKVSHLHKISHTYYAIESGVAVMCAGKAIHALCIKTISPMEESSQKSPVLSAPTAPIHILLALTTAVQWNAICKGCSKRGHWYAKCHSSGTAGQQPTKSNGAEKAPNH